MITTCSSIEHAEQISAITDDVAERARKIG